MSRLVASIDIGGTYTKLGLVNGAGQVQNFRRFPTLPPASNFIAELRKQLQGMISDHQDVSGIGVSIAGFIDPDHSMMIYNPNIAWMENVPLRSQLAQHFPLPIHLEVDSNTATVGEFRFGEGAGYRRFLFLTVGTGIGGGMTVNGKLLRLTHECLGDVGHVIVQPEGRRCPCGGIGCAEAVSAAPAILHRAGVATLPEVEERFFIEAGHHLGVLAASLSSIFFPDRIALGGGVCKASPRYVEEAIATFRRSSADAIRDTTSIVPARLGADASLIGATCPLLP